MAKFNGQPGPGRPKGSVSGRTRALLELDKLLSRPANLRKLREGLQGEFDKDPVRFFRGLIMPLLPRQSQVQDEASPGHVTEFGIPARDLIVAILEATPELQTQHPELAAKYLNRPQVQAAMDRLKLDAR